MSRDNAMISSKIDSIKQELIAAFRERCLKPDMGFQDTGSSGRWDIPWTDIVSRVDISYVNSDNEICDISNAEYARIEVGIELGYDGMSKISEAGDAVLYQYDRDAYFDAEEPGIISAYLNIDTISGVKGSTNISAADGNDFPEVIPAESLAEMSKNEMHDFLENLPVGTKITGIVDAPGTFGRKKWGEDDKIVKKEGGYTGPSYNRFGLSPSDTKYMDTWWTISGGKTHSWELVSIIQGKNKYYSVLALEDPDDYVESSVNIEAGMYDYPERPLEDDRPEPDWYEDKVEIEVSIDAVIDIDDAGGWEYEDTTYPWAKSPYDKRGNWYADTEYGEIYVGDPVDIVEKIDELLEVFLPARQGRYYITGDADLVFNIDNISGTSKYYGNDEEGTPVVENEYYTDDVDVEFNFSKSSIKNFNIEEIR